MLHLTQSTSHGSLPWIMACFTLNWLWGEGKLARSTVPSSFLWCEALQALHDGHEIQCTRSSSRLGSAEASQDRSVSTLPMASIAPALHLELHQHIDCHTCRAKDLQEQRKAEAYVRRMAALGGPVPVPDRLRSQQQQAPAQWQQAPASYGEVDVGSDAYQRQHMQGTPSTSARPTYGAPNGALHWELPQVRCPGLSVWCLEATKCSLLTSIRKHAAAVLNCEAAMSTPKQQSLQTAAGIVGGRLMATPSLHWLRCTCSTAPVLAANTTCANAARIGPLHQTHLPALATGGHRQGPTAQSRRAPAYTALLAVSVALPNMRLAPATDRRAAVLLWAGWAGACPVLIHCRAHYRLL